MTILSYWYYEISHWHTELWRSQERRLCLCRQDRFGLQDDFRREILFLSRPRRFGKSLLLSTFEAFFGGEKDLFEGLAVCDLEKEWTVHPILHLDLNSREYKDESSLSAELNRNLEKWEKRYGKGYAKPFAADPRKLFKIGLNFSTEKRCIDDWRVE